MAQFGKPLRDAICVRRAVSASIVDKTDNERSDHVLVLLSVAVCHELLAGFPLGTIVSNRGFSFGAAILLLRGRRENRLVPLQQLLLLLQNQLALLNNLLLLCQIPLLKQELLLLHLDLML